MCVLPLSNTKLKLLTLLLELYLDWAGLTLLTNSALIVVMVLSADGPTLSPELGAQ